MNEQKENLNKAYKIINDGIEALKSDVNFLKQYIDIQSKFDRHTVRNAILIARQQPDATELKGIDDWKQENISFTSKEPKNIIILEPCQGIKDYRAKIVIDISETDSKPKTKLYDKKLILQALLNKSEIPIKVVDELENNNICSWNQEDDKLIISRGHEIDKVVKAISTELAKCYIEKKYSDISNVHSEIVGYMVCKKFGIDVDDNSISEQIKTFQNISKKEIIFNCEILSKANYDLNTKIKHYLYNKEKSIKRKELER